MYQLVFEGIDYSYHYELETEQYMLIENKSNSHSILKGDDAFMFREHIELMKINDDKTLNDRIEKAIKIHYCFDAKPCPFPHFVK